MLVNIFERAFHAFVSSNSAFPAWSYRLRTWEIRDGCFATNEYIKPRRTAVTLLIRTSVAWQKKKEIFALSSRDRVSSSMIPHRIMVLPFPGSPLIQRRQLLWLSCHSLNCSLSRIQQYESFKQPSLGFFNAVFVITRISRSQIS